MNISEPEKPAAEPTEAAVVVKSEEIELQTKPEDVARDDVKEQPTEEAKEETKEEEKEEEKAGPSDEPKKEKTKVLIVYIVLKCNSQYFFHFSSISYAVLL